MEEKKDGAQRQGSLNERVEGEASARKKMARGRNSLCLQYVKSFGLGRKQLRRGRAIPKRGTQEKCGTERRWLGRVLDRKSTVPKVLVK